MTSHFRKILARAACFGLALALSFTAAGCSRRKTKEISGTYLGIDVSKFQGTVDYAAVREAGASFVMVRLGYRSAATGEITEDSNARYNLQSARDAGLSLGVYFFSAATSKEEALEEAAWVENLIAQYPITYPVVYDCEGFLDPESRQYGMSAQERTDNALAFLEAVEKAGYEGMFYASKSELEEQWETDRIAEDYKIWIAQYPAVPYPDTPAPDYEGSYQMWQYSQSGTVGGVKQNVDLNVALFGYDGTEPPKDKTPPESVSPDPEALMNFRDVPEETVTAKIQVNLRSEPSQEEGTQILFVLNNGETATRTGISDSGWSRLRYQDRVCYAVTSYLTDDLNYTPDSGSDNGLKTQFRDVDEQVTAKVEVNLRTMPSVENAESQVVVLLKNGETVRRTGISENGWSRLEYNGQTCYAVSSYLILADGSTEATEDDGQIKTQFEDVDDQVTPKEKVNLRTLPSVEDPQCQIAATIVSGETVHRTGINRDLGWSRVEYNGQTLYCITQYLKEAE